MINKTRGAISAIINCLESQTSKLMAETDAILLKIDTETGEIDLFLDKIYNKLVETLDLVDKAYFRLGEVKTETDKIPDIKTSTDLIPDIKTETDKITGIESNLDSCLDKIEEIKFTSDLIPDIKTETDKIDDIKTETDKIADIKTATDDIALVKTETDKIPDILEEVEFTEHHLHNWERGFGKAVTPSGETHVADRFGAGVVAFQIDAGNNAWGDPWVQILGSSDTPAVPGKTSYDLRHIQVTASERSQTYYIQIGFGATGNAALSANTYTEIPFTPGLTSKPDQFVVMTDLQPAGTKAWARCICPGQNTATIDFVFGVHEYS